MFFRVATLSLGLSLAAASELQSRQSLWQPSVGEKWQIVLSRAIDLPPTAQSVVPDVPIWDIDFTTNDQDQVGTLKRLGKRVICYFSAGTYEPGRPDSAALEQLPEGDLGEPLIDYPRERWLNLRSEGVRDVMRARIQAAQDAGCDAIDPDNLDAYDNNGGGLGLTEADSVDYIRFLASTAAGFGMSTGLKNAAAIVEEVLSVVQFSVQEQCVQYSECETYAPMIAANKPVFNIEYQENPDICTTSGQAVGSDGFSKVFKNGGDDAADDLDGFVRYCDGEEATTPIV